MFKLPPRTATLQFEGDYAGAEVVVKTNATLGVGDDISPDDPRSNVKLLPRIILSWNLEDDDGPIPISYDAMVARVGADLLGMIAVGYMKAVEAQAARDFPPPNGDASVNTTTTLAARPV